LKILKGPDPGTWTRSLRLRQFLDATYAKYKKNENFQNYSTDKGNPRAQYMSEKEAREGLTKWKRQVEPEARCSQGYSQRKNEGVTPSASVYIGGSQR
jgi:hypothetical protein